MNADQIAIVAARAMSQGRESTGRIVAAVLRNKAQVLMGSLETIAEGAINDQAFKDAFRDGCETIGVLTALADALEGR